MLSCTCEVNEMKPIDEAWALLKARPEIQAHLQGTSQPRTGGTIPQQLVRRPGETYDDTGNTRPAGAIHMRRFGNHQMRGGHPERAQRPSVGNERSFQTSAYTGQEESAISRPPKQGFLDRRRDAKQQRLAQRAEQTGAGADYRQAFPMNPTGSSVFEPSASTMQQIQRM